ncbi:MAG TPA: serine/threonine-protein kinase [Terriglobales bacterium]|nr:serine/threonine-protein kinase [Terriglobales bacterium]
MSNKIGRFEIQSEIRKSYRGSVFKASDPESGQTVALKTLTLEVLGDHRGTLVESILEESDRSKALNSHNIALLYGAGEIEGLFCAAMEYVQGNSIATMMARKEGFSIWDIQDIARQSCQGLDHAHTHNVVHASLEPAKIMVQWDGIVKLLGFGVSLMGAHPAEAAGAAPEVLHYMSPEQLRGEALDARSNLFSLGAILYEMVTERKAFEGEDAEQVRQSILEMTPVAPDQVNRKVHPALSEVVMKAIARNPEQRYQSGQELVNDLERCKESSTRSAARKSTQPPQGLNAPGKMKPAVNAPVTAQQPAPVADPAAAEPPAITTTAPAKPAVEKRAEVPSASAQTKAEAPEFEVQAAPAPPAKAAAAAAAAGWSGGKTPAVSKDVSPVPKLDPAAQFINSCVKASVEALATEHPETLPAATVEPEVESAPAEALPKLPVDPMVDESAHQAGSGGLSFSDLDELPPLKEVYLAPPPQAAEPEAAADSLPATVLRPSSVPDKPKVQPREVAKKAVTEIKKTPPKLFMYSIAAAVGVILLIIVAIAFHIHNENTDDDGGPAPAPAAAATPAPQPAAAPATPLATPSAQPAPAAEQPAPEPAAAEAPEVSVKPKYLASNSRKKGARTPPPAPTAIPGELTVNTTPAGAQITIDGRTDNSWMSPYNVAGLVPGQHAVTVSKAGYGSESRTIEVASASKSVLVIQLAQLAAQVSVASDPPGATIVLDGKDTGHITPTQLVLDKPGSHTLLLRKAGYLDETTTANLQSGQTFRYAPNMHPLGQTDDIKTVSKFKKVFGGGDTSSMGVVSIKTNPKGAQIAVNRRIIDKASPADFYLNPGTYVVDVTFPGYKDLHRVVTVDKGGKVVIDETMERQ